MSLSLALHFLFPLRIEFAFFSAFLSAIQVQISSGGIDCSTSSQRFSDGTAGQDEEEEDEDEEEEDEDEEEEEDDGDLLGFFFFDEEER